jgi:hypothetical protein
MGQSKMAMIARHLLGEGVALGNLLGKPRLPRFITSHTSMVTVMTGRKLTVQHARRLITAVLITATPNFALARAGGPWLLTCDGQQSGERFGRAVAFFDDDGDGTKDLVVAAPNHNGDLADQGRVFLYRGGSALTSVPMRWLDGSQSQELFGLALGCGDVDGDGVDELVVGAPGANGGAGRVYVIEPGATTAQALTRDGAAAGDRFGAALAVVRDLDGDSAAEIAVGAPGCDAAGTEAGRVTLLSLQQGALVIRRSFDGEQPGDAFGSALAAAGDLDGDGRGDFVVGSYQHASYGEELTGAAYVILGKHALDGGIDVTLTGENGRDRFGFTVGGGADLDGDGYDELLVAAPTHDTGASTRGASMYIAAARRARG